MSRYVTPMPLPSWYFGNGAESIARPKPTERQLLAAEANQKYEGKRLRWELSFHHLSPYGLISEDLHARGWQLDYEHDCLFRTRGF
jgi:hypothetical protein